MFHGIPPGSVSPSITPTVALVLQIMLWHVNFPKKILIWKINSLICIKKSLIEDERLPLASSLVTVVSE